MRDVSVYVHFPWCLRKCPYCDFATSPIERSALPHGAYANAVVRELELRTETIEHDRLVSVFFGGGTPSLWDPPELGRVLRAIWAAFNQHAQELEITVECNPSSLDADRARALVAQGVNRLSVGVQSLDNGELQFLGRLHDRQLALQAVEAALAHAPRVSADLMFGLPGQTVQGALAHAETLLGLGLQHVSAYALTIEPSTPFGERARKGTLPMASDDSFAEIFGALEARFAQAGLSHYEVSNYAKPGAESLHNLHYWRAGSYLGLGAAAVGCLHERGRARRYRNHPQPERYLERSSAHAVEVFHEDLDDRAIAREALMLGLRTLEGVNLTTLRRDHGIELANGREPALERLAQRGEVVLGSETLRVPAARWLHLDAIVAALF